MNKIKDIIYDKSDILLALLILAIAGLVIFWRLGIILEYPKEVVGGEDTENVLTEPEEPVDEAGEAAEQQTQEEGSGDAGESTETGEAEQSETGEAAEPENTTVEPEQSGELFEDGKLTRDLEVTITGNTASEAVQCLVDEGIFEDYDEYMKLCEKNGYQHDKVRAGVFTFKKGDKKLDIIKQINWTNS